MDSIDSADRYVHDAANGRSALEATGNSRDLLDWRIRSQRRRTCLLAIKRYRLPMKWLNCAFLMAEHEIVLRAVMLAES